MQTPSEIRTIAFLGEQIPPRCGTATFTSDLLKAIVAEFPGRQCLAVPVNDTKGNHDDLAPARFEIEKQNLASYRRAADLLNISNVDIVCLQHDFGVFGGNSGSHILELLRELKMPVVTTLHTLFHEPTAEQRRVMRELIARSTRLVVMAECGRQMLLEVYQAPATKIDLIPHGIPDLPFADSNLYKDQFGVAGKLVLLTFGLLTPDKGVENVIQALPEISEQFPNVVYFVLGATHPDLVREHGEAYRLGLERLARKNKVQKNVIFYDRFVEPETLKEFIGAADLCLTPYLNEAQITSGTLAYAFGSGKAVISTPYWHAKELLAEDRGVLVPFGDARAIAREAGGLLRDEARRTVLGKNAHETGRAMLWSNVARHYEKSFATARLERAVFPRKSFATKTLDQQPRELPALNLNHLLHLTDSTGIFQHAVFSVPNFSGGYCTDDNARAFILTLLLEELEAAPEHTQRLSTIYAAFLQHAYNPQTKRFRNVMGFERNWLDEQGSEDAHGRALWALGMGVGRSRHRNFQILAGQVFSGALPTVLEFASPRAWALTLIGIQEYLRVLGGDRVALQVRDVLIIRLLELFTRTARSDWHWFETTLAHDNAKLAHALIVCGQTTGQKTALELGLHTLRWLANLQTAEGGHFQPIGSNGFYPRDGKRATFDQQPIEAHAMISACLEAYRATGNPVWHEHAQLAFDWFLGGNDLGLEMYSADTGGCRDALHVDHVNSNQGAEATLAFLLSLAEMRLAQNILNGFNHSVS